ncbi:hypothetical protein SDC9_124627 [bioreactor metagenome]|uniref:Uncharacterized protein n=1 Tax=bioreactor metagenome TaxID=1076179 RepID=A0A645CKV3_9ZZZZ
MITRGPGQRTRIDKGTLGRDSLGHLFGIDRVNAFRLYHHFNGQVKLAGKFKVTLVMRRHGHDGAGAVGHEHIICYPDRDLCIIDWIDGITTRPDAGLFFIGGFTLNIRLAQCFSNIGIHLRLLGGRGQFFDQRMLRGQYHKGGSPQGIWPGGEHFQLITVFGLELDQCSC